MSLEQAAREALELLKDIYRYGSEENWRFPFLENIEKLEAALAQQEKPEPVAFDYQDNWELLAMELCAEEHGPESVHEMAWYGIPPEPWGVRFYRYESEAKRMIELVSRVYPQPPRREWVMLTREQIDEIGKDCEFLHEVAHAVQLKSKELNT